MRYYNVGYQCRKAGAIGILEWKYMLVEAVDHAAACRLAFESLHLQGYETSGVDWYECPIDYEGKPISKGDRVELHPGTDYWMRGARYGTVKGFSLTPNDRVKLVLDKLPNRTFSTTADNVRTVK